MNQSVKNSMYILTAFSAIVIGLFFIGWMSNGDVDFKLSKHWKFMVGDNMEWKNPDYDDKDWDEIRIHRPWEDEGYRGYNGYAWYRLKFKISDRYQGKTLTFNTNFIDDVDQTYFNGELIGETGIFPPGFQSAWNTPRKYIIPANLVNAGEWNYLAVRVYDNQGNGGITWSDAWIDVSISIPMEVDLMGEWLFKTDSTDTWINPKAKTTDWETHQLPSYWDSYGYQDFDGVAWYRKQFKMNNIGNGKYVLVLGKIDDRDKVYLNGKLIGQTWNMPEEGVRQYHQDHQQFRGYYFDAGLLKKDNVIAIKVFDRGMQGGIYSGPLGITTQQNYSDYWMELGRMRD